MDKNHALALDYLNIVTLMGIYGVFTIAGLTPTEWVLSYCDMKKSNWIYPVTSIKSHKNLNFKKKTLDYI